MAQISTPTSYYDNGVYDAAIMEAKMQNGGYATFNADHILIGNTTASSSYSAFTTKSKIDITPMSKLQFEVQGVSALYAIAEFGLFNVIDYNVAAVASVTIPTGNISRIVLELDVSGYNGTYYIASNYATNHTGYSLKIYRITPIY